MSLVDDFFNDRQSARETVVGLEDNNPDEAVRAIELSRVTGVPSVAVVNDIPGFEKQARDTLATEIINDNPALQDYINSNPMAARVSQDDWGNLDNITRRTESLPWYQNIPIVQHTQVIGKALGTYFEGMREQGHIGSWMYNTPEKAEWAATQPRSTLIALTALGLPFDLMSRVFGPVPGAAKTFVEEAYGQATGDYNTGQRLGREAAGFIEYVFNKPPVFSGPGPTTAVIANAELRALADSTGPYIRAGVEPPVGLHPMLDNLKKEQAKLDMEELGELTSDIQKSTTRERSPELFADLIRPQMQGANIYIPFDAIVKMYGDKPIKPDDGVLGWVPNIQEQVRTMSMTGGDIVIPLADWLAKSDKAVAKDLHDNIRVRRGGFTLEEAKEFDETRREMADVPREAPIVGFRRDAEVIEREMAPVEEGTTRLWRGNRPGEVGAATQFTNDIAGIALPFRRAYGGDLSYVDIPTKDLALYEQTVAAAPGAEFNLPPELAARAQVVEILDRNGEAVNAVRAQAALDRGLIQPQVQQVGRNIEVTTGPFSPAEKVMFKAVESLLDRIAPGARRLAGQEITMGGVEVQGAYQSFVNAKPLIMWSLNAESPMATGRHEAVHYLREYGFFTPAEWETLRSAAIEGNWLEKHNITKRYEQFGATPENMIEEAIAEEYSKTWAREPGNVKGALAQAFEKLHMLLVEMKEAILKAFGAEYSPEELFAMIERGEIGGRKDTTPLTVEEIQGEAKAQRKPEQGELDVTRQEDKAIFEKASAIGMTIPQYKRYLELIAKRNLEDIKAQRERAIAFEKKRQSTEWRQESEALEDEVRADLRNRPDIAAIEFLRYGELYGQKIDGRKPQLDTSLLTPEQRKLLPDQWLTDKGGLHPDDAAGLFGYSTGAELIDRLAASEQARGNVRPGEFFARQVKAEVERRMVEKYGELDANILSAAEDHVLGITQMDLLHEETVALGSRSGAEISFKKEDVQAWAETRFNESNASKVSAVRFLDEAGKAGRAAELALLKGDFAEAFKQKQRQYLSALMAKEAKAFEKETQRFERLADRFSRREGPKAVEQEFTDQIQALLLKAELPVRRTGAELQEAFDRAGYRSLDEFVSAQVADGYELAVQPYLSGPIKKAEDMSVQEAREFRTAIRSLNHIGREVKSIELAGVKEDFANFKEKVLANIKTLPFRPKESQGRWFYKWDAMQTKVEEIVKDLDLRKEMGPLFDALIRPMAESKHQEYTMLEKLAAKFTELRGANKAWQKTLDDAIPHNFFNDPNGTPFELTRQDMIGIMLNFGNKSNREKFVNGWRGKEDAAVFEQKLRTLLDQNAKKEDWDFVQNIWDVFDMWRKDANEMYYQLSGVPPKWIEPEAFANAHGSYRGGYFPVIYDKYWSGIEAKAASRADVMFGQNYHRSTPANHYTKERTGYTDFVEFQGSIEQVAARMQQEIHDIAYRRALIAAKKVISDKEIRAAIRQHYGSEYEAQLTPWMQKIASHYQMDEQAVAGANAFLRRIRYNLIGHALPLNLKVLLSPSTGLINPVSFGSMLWNRAANEKIAMANSKEIPHTFRNMDRDFRERLEATINAKGFTAFQSDVLRATFWPAVFAEQQFRIKTFVTEYQNNLVKGMSEGDAATAADSIVRERHGSAGLPDLPAIMSSNEAMKTYTMFYGFFNTMYNWQRQMPGQIRRGEYSNFLKTLYGTILVPSAFGALLFNQQKEGDSWFKTIGKALLLQPLATAVFARELGSAIIEGFPSRTGLGGVLQAMRTSMGDIEKMIKNKEVKKPIQHTANVVGLSTGLPLAQVGRTTQFAVDVNQGKQRPRNFSEWFRGIVSGEARLKK